MKRYKIVFYGRKKGAIGLFGFHQAKRVAESAEAAKLALYDEWEHIHQWRVVSEEQV